MSTHIRIGTRDSQLAIWQAKVVQKQLENLGYYTSIVKVKSTGDIILNKPIYEMGITGVFTKTLDIALLNEEIEILNESNNKLTDKNKLLNSETNQLKQEIKDLQTKIKIQSDKINENKINQEELEFLKLNLIYSSKCQKTVFKKGYKVGTQEYRDCIFRKGNKVDD